MSQRIFFLIFIFIGLCSCTPDKNNKGEDILASVDNSILKKSDIIQVIPRGLSKIDSTKFIENYIHAWIDKELLLNVASKEIANLDKIDKLVEDYKVSLIAYEYKKMAVLSDKSAYNIPEDSLKIFFNNNKSLFELEVPIIKGIYLKVQNDSKQINNVRKWYHSLKVEDIDKLDNFGLNEANQYLYFRNKWIALPEIEKNFPNKLDIREIFVKTNKSYELSKNGFVYLLNITDYREKGEIMPFDYAKSKIKEIFVNRNQRKVDADMMKKLHDDAIKSGDLKIYYKK